MTAQTHIRLLPDDVINKIAAGEVVERPASVLKELMENSLDSGAGQIDVEIVAGGKSLIAVTDDGSGMTRDDALLAVERHATSKIRDAADIEKIATLGFRGEALAAISSVSRFALITRPEDAVEGTQIHIHGGAMNRVEETGCPPGTRIEIRNLFYNVPARKKFLRTDSTELSHIRQLFLTYAFVHPECGFSLTVDGRMMHRVPRGESLDERLTAFLDAETVSKMITISFSGPHLSVTGKIGRPELHRGDRAGQYVYINGRPASAPLIAYAVRSAYEGWVPKGRHPVVVLFVNVAPSSVDVNVHPTKREVRFRQPGGVRDDLLMAFSMGLQELIGTGPQSGSGHEAAKMKHQSVPSLSAPPRITHQGSFHTPRVFQYPHQPVSRPPVESSCQPDKKQEPEPVQKKEAAPAETPSVLWAYVRIIGRIGSRYLALETNEGLVVMDIHRAHQRVLYEDILRRYKMKKTETQKLLVPENVEFPPKDAQVIREHLQELRAMGFDVEEFGADAFIVEALPPYVTNISIKQLLLDVVQEYAVQQGRAGKRTALWSDVLARMASGAAVQKDDRMTHQMLEKLVEDLSKSEMPYTSPAGNPTLFFMSHRELDRKFGRTS